MMLNNDEKKQVSVEDKKKLVDELVAFMEKLDEMRVSYTDTASTASGMFRLIHRRYVNSACCNSCCC